MQAALAGEFVGHVIMCEVGPGCRDCCQIATDQQLRHVMVCALLEVVLTYRQVYIAVAGLNGLVCGVLFERCHRVGSGCQITTDQQLRHVMVCALLEVVFTYGRA